MRLTAQPCQTRAQRFPAYTWFANATDHDSRKSSENPSGARRDCDRTVTSSRIYTGHVTGRPSCGFQNPTCGHMPWQCTGVRGPRDLPPCTWIPHACSAPPSMPMFVSATNSTLKSCFCLPRQPASRRARKAIRRADARSPLSVMTSTVVHGPDRARKKRAYRHKNLMQAAEHPRCPAADGGPAGVGG